MRTKLTIIIPLLLLVQVCWGQQTEDEIYDAVNKEHKKELEKPTDSTKLVPNKAFNKIVKNDFEKIQTVTPVSNVTNRFASLDINKEKQTFSLSPLVYDAGQHIFGINFSGTLNSKGFFDFKDRNQVAVGLNYTFYHASKGFKNKHREELYELYEAVKRHALSDKKQIKDIWIKTEKSKDSIVLKEKYEEMLTEYEMAFAEKYWTSKSMYWVTVNFTPFNKDNFRYLLEGDTQSYQNPYKESLNVLNLSVSFNYYFENKNWIVSPSLNISGSNKHTLSEIYSTKQWNKIAPLTSGTYLSEDNKNVYVLSDNKFSRLFLIDTSLKCILLSKRRNMGLDVSYTSTSFITPGTSNYVSKINEYSFGFIIPFVDSKGERTINIVPFYSYKQFIDYESESESVLGVKFNIPLK